MSGWPEWRCPVHGEALRSDPSGLICSREHSYPVLDGIPRFVGGRTYADAFGAQWRRYTRTQLDSYTGLPITHARTRRTVGEALWGRLEGALVLECGCGAGRFTEVLLARGARVVSLDLSDAVDANQQNFPQDARHRIAQADLRQLPFAPATFDLVFCLGVLQHLPDPEFGIRALARHVAPGGALVVDHYDFRASWYSRLAALIRPILLRLPPRTGLRVTEILVDLFLPLHAASRSRWWQTLIARVSPVIAYEAAFPEMPEHIRREWAQLDTHDSLTDRYKHFRSPAWLRDVMVRAGLSDVVAEKQGPVAVARGRQARNDRCHD